MDPEAALEECRKAASAITDALDREQAPDSDDVQLLSESFMALDAWLTNDGFLPEGWKAEEDKR